MKHYLKDHDWVMWLDADTIVTNPDIRLESLVPRSTNGPDFVITVDGGGYNAGIWLLRRSDWAYKFLDRWWDMKQYITVRTRTLGCSSQPRKCRGLQHTASCRMAAETARFW